MIGTLTEKEGSRDKSGQLEESCKDASRFFGWASLHWIQALVNTCTWTLLLANDDVIDGAIASDIRDCTSHRSNLCVISFCDYKYEDLESLKLYSET